MDETNYRSLINLPAISKTFEREHVQINNYMSTFFSSYPCDHHKALSAQQAFLALVENWKKRLYQKDYGGAVSMYLSKV